ncbi:MAG: hypothetical protein UX10_C0021G0021 [Candidatus Magasanikbacteria bacterium GW2011_GWA2_45_39]|uniref:DUF6938 domain-containing protein n=2 Tax=Candidatus Magasanikiibacteriota TaxID=1752731 RepID=A0A0G1MZ57_9BACT|nr:MAG: hypothetical protein UX10_C0021G0021 [Candidatus Magasanikbacteria bacterium GW2011_GWA2_45_39]KKU13524.1 MAG: hypothetical protein UX20_C0019G0005 [Candidatus Magasanikbacteria bacterium GW2011_GWC2_45_8]HBW73945.1 hypothetical protein [Candidatus Magasanikbacteria bacterium]
MAHHEHALSQAHVVAVDMGYGHQRAAFPLRHLAPESQVIYADAYEGIPLDDEKIWKESRIFYEFISRFKRVPLIGELAFKVFDNLQKIPNFYPRRDLSHNTLYLKELYALIHKKRWGEHLIQKLNKNPLPLITSFFAVAFMAEELNYEGDIYCIICDADISRTWAPLDPQKSRIKYFASCSRTAERLKLYGVSSENIFLTGFPLPEENLGGEDLLALKEDLQHRLINLDPQEHYLLRYSEVVQHAIGIEHVGHKSNHPLTLTFAVGGAGAQREIGAAAVKSLKKKIQNNELALILVAGINKEVTAYFENELARAGLKNHPNTRVIDGPTKNDYFSEFDKALRHTDILWTKPSELSFYAGLGIPIIMAPSIGSQEDFNRTWLKTVGAGITQNDPRFADEWIFDWLNNGLLAAAAMQGFLEIPKTGTYNIEQIVGSRKEKAKPAEMVLQT